MALTVEQERQGQAFTACVFVSIAYEMGVYPTGISDSLEIQCTFEDKNLFKAAGHLATAARASWAKAHGYPDLSPEWTSDRIYQESVDAFVDCLDAADFPPENCQRILQLDLVGRAQTLLDKLLSKGSLNADDLRRLSQ